MADFIQTVLSGLTMGGVYALAALGLVLLFRASGIINFAHGNMGMFATFVAMTLLTWSFGAGSQTARSVIPYWVAIAGGLVFSVFLGLLVERVVIRPLVSRPPLSSIMACVGILMLLDSLSGWMWSHDDRTFPPIFSEASVLDVGGVVISYNNIAILTIVTIAIVIFQLFLKYTRFGLAMRCSAEDLEVSRLMGINYRRIFAVSWAIVTFLGGLAGMLLAPQLFLNPGFMTPVLIKGFVAAVIGGFSNLYGTILGGAVLGILESLTIVYVSTELKNIFAFAVIILILVIRPSGLIPEHKFHREV